jgi:hypothetical protein
MGIMGGVLKCPIVLEDKAEREREDAERRLETQG